MVFEREFSQHLYLALFSKVFHSNTVYQMVMERERNEIGYKANSQYWCLTAGHSTGNVSMTSASSAIVLRAAVNPFLICKASHTWSKMGHHGHFAVKKCCFAVKNLLIGHSNCHTFLGKKNN